MDEPSGSVEKPSRRHETSDADIRSIVKFAVGLFLTIVASVVVVSALFNYFVAHQGLGPPASPFENTRKLPPPNVPLLQVAPPRELAHYRKEQEDLLDSYGWVDRKAGIVRIPIDRAMDLLVQRGLPVRTAPAQGELQPGTVQQYTVPKGYTPEH